MTEVFEVKFVFTCSSELSVLELGESVANEETDSLKTEEVAMSSAPESFCKDRTEIEVE